MIPDIPFVREDARLRAALLANITASGCDAILRVELDATSTRRCKDEIVASGSA